MDDRSLPEPLARLVELHGKTTQGDWRIPVANVFRVIAPDAPHHNMPDGMCPPYPWRIICDAGSEDTAPEEMRFIAASHNLLPAIVQMVGELQKQIFTPAQLDALLERWDQTEPDMQRKIVVAFMARSELRVDRIHALESQLTEARRRLARLKDLYKSTDRYPMTDADMEEFLSRKEGPSDGG